MRTYLSTYLQNMVKIVTKRAEDTVGRYIRRCWPERGNSLLVNYFNNLLYNVQIGEADLQKAQHRC